MVFDRLTMGQHLDDAVTQATTAPSCDAFDPITGVTFIVEASCDVVDGSFTQEFLLSESLA